MVYVSVCVIDGRGGKSTRLEERLGNDSVLFMKSNVCLCFSTSLSGTADYPLIKSSPNKNTQWQIH